MRSIPKMKLCTHTSTHTHACMHTYVHTHACMHTYVHTHMHACTHTYTHTHGMHAHIHTCMHTCMHTYTHTHMHAHMHAHSPKMKLDASNVTELDELFHTLDSDGGGSLDLNEVCM